MAVRMKWITVHCSATPPSRNYTLEDLRRDHINRGFRDIGYHRYITRDGVVHRGRPIPEVGAHVKGHNVDNIGVCMEGGVDERGKATFNYTDAQLDALRLEIIDLTSVYGVPNPPLGHRDWSPDLNGDGTIQANEFIKECPCFDVGEWWKSVTE